MYTSTNKTLFQSLFDTPQSKRSQEELQRNIENFMREEHIVMITKLKFYWTLSEITGDSCDLNSLHCPVHHCIDFEHDTSDASL